MLRDLIYDFEPADVEDRLAAWFAGAVDDPATGYTAADLAKHVRLEFSTFRWLFEAILAHAGFAVIEQSFERGVYGRYLCRRR